MQEVQSLEAQKSIALGDISQEQSEALKPLWQSFNGFFNSLQNVASQFRRFEQDSIKTHDLEQQLSTANQTINNLRATIDSMNRKQAPQDSSSEISYLIQRPLLLEIVPQIAQKTHL
jgi:hypothetical protein